MNEYKTTDELSAFLYACVYLCETLENDTYGYWIGSEGLDALEFLSDGDIDGFYTHMDKSLEYYNDAPKVDSAENDVKEPFSIGKGIYIVGEDIPAGKYDIAAINGSGGAVRFYQNYEIYKNDGRKDGYYFLYAEDSRYYSNGDSSTI